jgi:hypothetical protein
MVIQDVEADTLYAPFRFVACAAGYRAVQSTPIIGREGALSGTEQLHAHHLDYSKSPRDVVWVCR